MSDEKAFYTIAEVAILLGVSADLIRRSITTDVEQRGNGRIFVHRFGRRMVIPRWVVDELTHPPAGVVDDAESVRGKAEHAKRVAELFDLIVGRNGV